MGRNRSNQRRPSAAERKARRQPHPQQLRLPFDEAEFAEMRRQQAIIESAFTTVKRSRKVGRNG